MLLPPVNGLVSLRTSKDSPGCVGGAPKEMRRTSVPSPDCCPRPGERASTTAFAGEAPSEAGDATGEGEGM